MIAILAGLMLLTSEVTCAVSKTHLEYSKVSMVDGSTYKMRLLDKYGDEIKSSNIAWKRLVKMEKSQRKRKAL